MHIANGNVELRANRIVTNTAIIPGGDRGGGVYIAQGNVAVSDSYFGNNSASLMGGGIHIEDGAVTIRRSTFENNLSYSGGAIMVTILGDLWLADNSIIMNSGSYGRHKG